MIPTREGQRSVSDRRKFVPVDEQLAYLRKGAAEIIREEELKAKLEASRSPESRCA